MRQLIIARKDLNMSAGKLAAQVSHASMAFLTAPLRNAKGDKNRIKRIENGDYVFEIKMDARRLTMIGFAGFLQKQYVRQETRISY